MDKATKAKLLQAAITKLKKSHGEDVLLDTTNPIKYEVIPSGSLLFDQATGIGGIALAKITEIYGENSVGKCLTKDTYIDTPQGLMTIEEIFNSEGEQTFTVTKTKPIVYPLYNEKGQIENTTHFTWNGKRKVLKITTRSGTEVKVTHNHPLRTLSTNCNIVWTKGQSLSIGDYLVLPFKNNPLKDEIPRGNLEAEFLGYLVADGAIHDNGSIRFSNTDPCVIERFDYIAKQLFNKVPSVYANHTRQFNSKDVPSFYERYSIRTFPLKSKDKDIPLVIRQADFNTRREFIRAYMELDSHLSSKGIEVVSASKELLTQLKYLLQADYNIISKLTIKPVQLEGWDEPKDYWRLHITGKSFERYLQYIGYRTKARLDIVNGIDAFSITLFDGLPNGSVLAEDFVNSLSFYENKQFNFKVKSLTSHFWYDLLETVKEGDGDQYLKNKITDLLENYFYDPIVAIEELPEKQSTFDFSMEHSASFIANGIASHNTSWAYSLCAQAQKKYPDRMVLYVDIESAVSLDYMQQFGVDISPDKFMIASPNSAEEGFDIMETMIDTGLFSLVIYDSVGASLTIDQIEKGMDQNTMASLAKKMSVGCNKIKNSVKVANTAVVFINQVYSSMAMYGSPTATKGGKALPYVASMRIQLSKRDLIASESNKEDVVGQAFRFKFIKNKLGKSYQEGGTILYFGKGFDQTYEVVDLAVQYGIIGKGGAWFNFEVPEKEGSSKMVPMKFQGKDKVLEYFRNDSMGFNYIKDIVIQKFSSSTSTTPVADEDGYGEED